MQSNLVSDEIERNEVQEIEESLAHNEQFLNEEIHLCLVNSDPAECNHNLSVYLKRVTELILLVAGDIRKTYRKSVDYCVKLVTLTLFIRNYELCIAKILALLSTLSCMQPQSPIGSPKNDFEREVSHMKSLICMTLYTVLKVKNQEEVEDSFKALDNIDAGELYSTLEKVGFLGIMSTFLVNHMKYIEFSESPYVHFKIGCDIIYEYFLQREVISDKELEDLAVNSELPSYLINQLLLSNLDELHDDSNYSKAKAIEYEQFKMILLINEQYVMKSYYERGLRNAIFDILVGSGPNEFFDGEKSKMHDFFNVSIFYLNREESNVIKILILKFLYLVFTTSYTSTSLYMNDLKLLVDIFVRELNNVEYSENTSNENAALIITYLKVLYPLLAFSQLNDVNYKDKKEDIVNLMKSLILQSDTRYLQRSNVGETNVNEDLGRTIMRLSMRCLSVPWLRSGHLDVNPSNDITADDGFRKVQVPLTAPNCSDRSESRLSTGYEHHSSSFSLDTDKSSEKVSNRIYYEMRRMNSSPNLGKNGSAQRSSQCGSPGDSLEGSPHIYDNTAFRSTHSNSSGHNDDLLNVFDGIFEDQIPNTPQPRTNNSTGSSNKFFSNNCRTFKKRAPPPPPPPVPRHRR